MYLDFFGLREMPFSITPDPLFLYMSPRHQEALGHLLYGTGQYGGFVQLTGEVGTGKTTIIRTLLEQKLDNVDVAMVHNPRQSEAEFVRSICDEMGVRYGSGYAASAVSLKELHDALNRHLLDAHARGRRVVLIIDEAQNLEPAVLEQVRLLTNLETHKEKLLRIMLVGQPELQTLLARPDLRQLAQRITARYHLEPLNAADTAEYIRHRLRIAGAERLIFDPSALQMVYRKSGGVPRLVNIICDRALLGAYSLGRPSVTAGIVAQAAWEATSGTVPAERRESPGRRATDRLLARSGFWVSTEKLWAGMALVFAGMFLVQLLRGPSISEEPISAEPTAASVPMPAPAPTPRAAPATVPVAPAPEPETLALHAAQPLPVLTSSLTALWGINQAFPASTNVCDALRGQGLQCYRSSGAWSDLASLNRPAILTLNTPAGEERHVLLRGLNPSQARLQVGAGIQSVPLSALEAMWNGEFLLLWRRETLETMIGPLSRGNDVIWLRKRLAQATSRPLPPFLSSFYDADLKQAVQRFQQLHGLDADGLTGIRTLIALGSALPNTPTLNDAP